MAEPLTNQPKLADAALVSEWRRLVVDSHESLVAERGEGWAAFWGSEDSQRGRYRVFLEELPLDGSDVLEVGCGFGDFLDCAALAGVRPRRYLGIDLSERILSVARRRHPGHEFAVLDILSEAPTFAPDYIIASGIMAVDLPEYEAYVLFTLRRLFALCRRGFALNFLSTATRSPDGKSRYVDPSWLLGTFQRHVDWSCRILHDYRQNDFTLVYKRRK